MKLSSIGWTDYSGGALNFIRGCTPVSEGCAHCYARAMYERFGLDFRPRLDACKLARLATMRFPEHSPKRGAPHKPMAFVCDTGDLFHESIQAANIEWAFFTMTQREDVVWQVLTKRIDRAHDLLALWNVRFGWEPPANIWLGVTVENQARADERIPALLATPAAVKFVSVEPMLWAVNINVASWGAGLSRPPIEIQSRQIENSCAALDWVICGAESGPNRRPFDVAWALDLYEQCRAAGVPFFYKQGSSLHPGQDDELPGIGKVKEWPE